MRSHVESVPAMKMATYSSGSAIATGSDLLIAYCASSAQALHTSHSTIQKCTHDTGSAGLEVSRRHFQPRVASRSAVRECDVLCLVCALLKMLAAIIELRVP